MKIRDYLLVIACMAWLRRRSDYSTGIRFRALLLCLSNVSIVKTYSRYVITRLISTASYLSHNSVKFNSLNVMSWIKTVIFMKDREVKRGCSAIILTKLFQKILIENYEVVGSYSHHWNRIAAPIFQHLPLVVMSIRFIYLLHFHRKHFLPSTLHDTVQIPISSLHLLRPM